MPITKTSDITHFPEVNGTNELLRDIIDDLNAVRSATSTLAIGDLLYANTTTSLARLAAVATGNALISGGVNTAPSWGKIGLATHVSGALPEANGGTGVSVANAVRANSTSGQSASSGFETTLTFDAEVFDTNSMHSTSSLTSRVNIITTGVYVVTGHCQMSGVAAAAGQIEARLLQNNYGYVTRQSIWIPAAGAYTDQLSVATIVSATAGDYMELIVYQSTGASSTVGTRSLCAARVAG